MPCRRTLSLRTPPPRMPCRRSSQSSPFGVGGAGVLELAGSARWSRRCGEDGSTHPRSHLLDEVARPPGLVVRLQGSLELQRRAGAGRPPQLQKGRATGAGAVLAEGALLDRQLVGPQL